jgi:hypothetical protein
VGETVGISAGVTQCHEAVEATTLFICAASSPTSQFRIGWPGGSNREMSLLSLDLSVFHGTV